LDDYTQYIQRKISHVASGYSQEIGRKNIEIPIVFTVACDGTLKGVPEPLSESDAELEQIAVQSIKEAAPFPPFPESITESEMKFELSIVFE
jgi:outer membrane biosynthesis protein TonB